MNSTRIIFVSGRIDFPSGPATASRMRLLALGFLENKVKTEVLLCGPGTAQKKGKFQPKGSFKGINFRFLTPPINYKYPFYIAKIIAFFRLRLELIHTAFLLLRDRNQTPVLMFIVFSRNAEVILTFRIIASLLRIPLCIDVCEWPAVQMQKNFINFIKTIIFERIGLQLADILFPISKYIEEQIKLLEKHGFRPYKIIRLPILVDTGEFCCKSMPPQYPFFLFCGTTGYFNIIELIIDSFTKVLKEHSTIKLILAGNLDKDLIERKVKELGIESKIEMTGYISWDKLKILYLNATAHLIPLPEDLRSKARFPTKIGEYLASGRPVITTAVGEVMEYLRDKETALIAKSFDSYLIAEQMVFALTENEIAFKIGSQGRKIASQYFNNAMHARKIIDLINK